MFLFNRLGAAKITPQELKEMMERKEKFTLIDVRTPQEFMTGHIPGSKNVPTSSFMDKIEKVVPKKDSLVVLYCQSGMRSAQAARAMSQLGYGNVKNLGAISKWSFGLKK